MILEWDEDEKLPQGHPNCPIVGRDAKPYVTDNLLFPQQDTSVKASTSKNTSIKSGKFKIRPKIVAEDF